MSTNVAWLLGFLWFHWRCAQMWPTLECWCWCLTEPLARTWRLYIPSVGGGTGYPRPPGHTTATSSTQGENGHKKWGLVDSLDRRWMPSWWECVGFVWWCQMSGCSDCSGKLWCVTAGMFKAHSTLWTDVICLSISGFVSNHESFVEHPVLPWVAVSALSWPAQCQITASHVSCVQCTGSDQAETSGDWHRTAKDLDHFCSFCIHNTI